LSQYSKYPFHVKSKSEALHTLIIKSYWLTRFRRYSWSGDGKYAKIDQH